MGGHGQDFGQELVSESVSEADSDSDMRFFETSDTDSIAEPRAQSSRDVRVFLETYTAEIEKTGEMTSRHLTISNIQTSRDNTVIHLSTIPQQSL